MADTKESLEDPIKGNSKSFKSKGQFVEQGLEIS